MTNQHTDEMRGAFEDAAKEIYGWSMLRFSDGKYTSPSVQNNWLIYQTATTRYQDALQKLRGFASHDDDCHINGYGNKECTCGYSKIIADINKLLGEKP